MDESEFPVCEDRGIDWLSEEEYNRLKEESMAKKKKKKAKKKNKKKKTKNKKTNHKRYSAKRHSVFKVSG